MWIHEKNCSVAFWVLLPAQRNVKIDSHERNAIFAHDVCTEVYGGIFEHLL